MKRLILSLICLILIGGCINQIADDTNVGDTESLVPDDLNVIDPPSSYDEQIPCCPACPEDADCGPCHPASISCN